MLPSKLLHNPPCLFGTFVILDIDDFIPCIGLECCYWFCILEHKVGRAKSKPFLHDVCEIWGNWIAWWEDKIPNRWNVFRFFQQVFPTPAHLVKFVNQKALDEGPIVFKGGKDSLNFLWLEWRSGQSEQLLEGDDWEILYERSNVLPAKFHGVDTTALFDRSESTAEILDNVPGSNEWLDQFPEFI